jgi:hypothetical protein
LKLTTTLICLTISSLVAYSQVPAAKAPTPLPSPFPSVCGTSKLKPNFPLPAPTAALGIDTSCSLAGAGSAETAQNQAKNNFCGTGIPKPVKIADLQQLFQTVKNTLPAINFGDEAEAGVRKAGPTQDRKPLQALGEGTQAVFQGFVLIARQEGAESVNCGKVEPDEPVFHDIHISLVESASTQLADECSSIVAEMSPHHRPNSWNQENVQALAAAHLPVRVTGQLFFDSSHVPCANGVKVRSNPKRSSLWEIHPIYKFEVCAAKDCTVATSWLTLDKWVASKSSTKGSPKKGAL